VPRELWGGGSVAQYQHATQGGRAPGLALLGRQACRSRGSRAGRPQRLRCSCLMQHRMEALTPLVGLRWGPPHALCVPFWKGGLWHRAHDAEALVDQRGEGPRILRPVAAARAGLSSTGVSLPRPG